MKADQGVALVTAAVTGRHGVTDTDREPAGTDTATLRQHLGERIWYAICTNVRAEAMAARRLKAAGYDVLYLHVEACTRHARKVTVVQRAYYSRYLFVGLTVRQPLHDVLVTPGVCGVCGVDGRPERVPPRVIARLLDRADATGKVVITREEQRQRDRLPEGHPLRIVKGPFSSFAAIVAFDSGSLLDVWVDVFGRGTKVSLLPDAVEALSVSPKVRSHVG